MKATDVMTRSVVTCSKNDSLACAVELLRKYAVDYLVVTDAVNQPVGTITGQDIEMAPRAPGTCLPERQVEGFMARRVCICDLDDQDDASDVEEVMRLARVERVLVTNSNGEVVGVVALSDLGTLSRSDAAPDDSAAARHLP